MEVAARLERASALSRAIRDTLTPEVRCSITSDPQAAARLEALDATCYRIELTRNVHNVDVAGVRALRSARMVKLLRLAGRAPIPEPIDFDDDTHIGRTRILICDAPIGEGRAKTTGSRSSVPPPSVRPAALVRPRPTKLLPCGSHRRLSIPSPGLNRPDRCRD